MSPCRLAFVPVLLLVGCMPPPSAPGEVDDLARFLFQHADTERPDELVVGIQALELQLLSVPLEGNPDERSWPLASLSQEYLGLVEATPGAVVEEQVSQGLAGLYRHGFGAMLELLADSNQVCITSSSYVYYAREHLDEADCLLSGACVEAEAIDRTYAVSTLVDQWAWYPTLVRLIELDDGRQAVVWRSWLEQSFISEMGWGDLEQRYALDLAFPTPGGEGLYRFSARWLSMGEGEVGDDAVREMLEDDMNSAFDNENAFSASEPCDLDRDADYFPPF